MNLISFVSNKKILSQRRRREKEREVLLKNDFHSVRYVISFSCTSYIHNINMKEVWIASKCNKRTSHENESEREVERRKKRKYSQRFSRHVFEQFSFNLFSQQTDESNVLLFLLLQDTASISISSCAQLSLSSFFSLVCSRAIKVIILKHNVRVPIEILAFRVSPTQFSVCVWKSFD
jgi:hypothetical protein